MRTKNILWYETRVVFGLSALGAILLPVLVAAFQWLAWANRATPPLAYEAIRALELMVPLAAGLGAAHLMAVEHQEHFAELRRTYAESPWRLPLLRTGGALALGLLTTVVSAVIIRLGYGPYAIDQVVFPAVAPALYLLGIALLFSNLSGTQWAAAGAVMAYWFIEVFTMGSLTKGLFLFNTSYPVDNVAQTTNRALLIGIGLGLLVLNA